MNAPQRGEVWLVDLGMTAKVRPALVVSIPASHADRALVTIVPHTTGVRHSRLEVAVSVSFLRSGAFDAKNLVTIPHAKPLRRIGRLGGTQLLSVERVLRERLGLAGISPEA